MDVKIIEGKKTISESLGLSDERNEEIFQHVVEMTKNEVNVDEMYKTVLNTYETDEEVLFAVYQIGSVTQQYIQIQKQSIFDMPMK